MLSRFSEIFNPAMHYGNVSGTKCKQTAREEFILTIDDTNMDVNNVVRIEDNNNLKVLDRLKEQFPDKNLDPAGMKSIDFLSWKLVDLKKFLMITGGYKGLSKAKKERVCETVTKTWKDLSSTYYNDTDVASVRDEELMSLPSSPSSMAWFLFPLHQIQNSCFQLLHHHHYLPQLYHSSVIQ